MKIAISMIIIGLFILGAFHNVLAADNNDGIITKSNLIFRDDFDYESDYWFWHDAYPAYHYFENGIVKFTVPWANWGLMKSGKNCTSEMWENTTSPSFKYNNMEIRVKVENISRGSKGWGFWNSDTNPFNISLAWFMFQLSSNIFFPLKGLWIMVVDGNIFDITLKRIRGVDIREWHTYNINWTENYVDFYVDDELVSHATRGVPQKNCRAWVWNDNAMWYPIPIFQRIIRPTTLCVDYLEITE